MNRHEGVSFEGETPAVGRGDCTMFARAVHAAHQIGADPGSRIGHATVLCAV
jgi:hypothetical protein